MSTNGTFSVEGSAKEMYILIEFLSFSTKRIDNIMPKDGQKSITLGDIVNFLMLSETVEIVGEKSKTTFALDKRVFNIEQGSIKHICGNCPSVDVDGETCEKEVEMSEF